MSERTYTADEILQAISRVSLAWQNSLINEARECNRTAWESAIYDSHTTSLRVLYKLLAELGFAMDEPDAAVQYAELLSGDSYRQITLAMTSNGKRWHK